MPLLEVAGMEVEFETPEGLVRAVNGFDFSLDKGETLAIVGESGSGKTQMMLAMLGLLAENGRARGRAVFDGEDLMQMTPKPMSSVRGKP